VRPSKKCHATSDWAQRGRLEPCWEEVSDLPGRADFKVARHFLIVAAAPLEGGANDPLQDGLLQDFRSFRLP